MVSSWNEPAIVKSVHGSAKSGYILQTVTLQTTSEAGPLSARGLLSGSVIIEAIRKLYQNCRVFRDE